MTNHSVQIQQHRQPNEVKEAAQVKDKDSAMATSPRLQGLADWLNKVLSNLSTAEQRLHFVLNHIAGPSGQNVTLTTSFGIHSSLMLHLTKQATMKSPYQIQVPVIWIDTGYLPLETYQFAERLRGVFDLDLRCYQGTMSSARMEAIHGKLWEDPSDDAHRLYNYMRKVEPMNRALQDLNVSIVLSGLRGGQTNHRKQLQMVHVHDGRLKICPILDWSEAQVTSYFEKHGLPYHPLHNQGYRSVGDSHSSQPYDPSVHSSERETRFHGRTQECGLHLSASAPDLLRASFASTSSGSIASTILKDNDGFVLYTKPNCRFCRGAKKLIGFLRDELIGRQNGVDNTDSASLTASDSSVSSSPSSSSSSPPPTVVLFPIEEIEVGKNVSRVELEIGLGRTIKTVPQILYKGEYIGGYTDLVDWIRRSYPDMVLPDTDKLVEKQTE